MALSGCSLSSPYVLPNGPKLQVKYSEKPSPNIHTIDTPVRDRLRKFVKQNEVTELEELERYLSTQGTTYSSLSLQIVEADVGNNILKRFLLITRKIKSFHEQLGPYDAVKLVVNSDGHYRLICYGRSIEENDITPPFNAASSILNTLSKLVDVSWVVCPGIQRYSEFMGAHTKRVTTENCLPDSVRDCDCTILYRTKRSTSKALICDKCTYLKSQLTKSKRKKEQQDPQEIPAAQKIKRQNTS